MTDEVSSFDLYLRKQLEDPAKRAAYEDYEARCALVNDLVARRKELGVTQREVAAHMGVKQPMVSGYENEDSDPRLSTIYRYARAVRPAFHFFWTNRTVVVVGGGIGDEPGGPMQATDLSRALCRTKASTSAR